MTLYLFILEELNSIAQLKEEPASPSITDFHDDLDNSEDESKHVKIQFPVQQPIIKQNEPTQPRKKILRFLEYPEKQLLVYGDFNFQLLRSSEKGECQVKCSICDLIIPYTKTKGRIKDHIFKIHTDSFVCSQCPSRFSRGRKLRDHVKSVHEGQPQKRSIIECTICKKPISSSNRKQHEWSHKSKQEKEEALKDPTLPQWLRNERKLQCDKCEEWFSGSSHLKKHQERKHKDPEERRELCSECGGSYLNLRIHMRHIHGMGEVDGVVNLMKTCLEPGCGKKFLDLAHLTKHKNQVHKKLKPFECSECGKCFGGKGNLKEHMKCHTLNFKTNPL